jgi:hypothetical protein
LLLRLAGLPGPDQRRWGRGLINENGVAAISVLFSWNDLPQKTPPTRIKSAISSSNTFHLLNPQDADPIKDSIWPTILILIFHRIRLISVAYCKVGGA